MVKKRQRPLLNARRQDPVKAAHGSTGHREPATRARAAWRWRTFPVFFAFVAGMLLAGFLNGAPTNTTAAVAQVAAVAGFGYCLAHLFVANVIIAGRVKRRRQAMDRGEEPAEDFEDELVYTAESPRD